MLSYTGLRWTWASNPIAPDRLSHCLPSRRQICGGEEAWIDSHVAAQGDQHGIGHVKGEAGEELPALIFGIVNNQQNRKGFRDTHTLRDNNAALGLIEWPSAHEL